MASGGTQSLGICIAFGANRCHGWVCGRPENPARPMSIFHLPGLSGTSIVYYWIVTDKNPMKEHWVLFSLEGIKK